MKKLLLLLIAMIPLVAVGQSATMMAMAQAELQKRGLNETEVRTRLMEEGIDVDNIPPSEYINYQSRVLAILNQMQSEKAAADLNPAAAATGGANFVTSALDVPQTTNGEAAAEDALDAALKDNKVSPTEGNDIYGHSMGDKILISFEYPVSKIFFEIAKLDGKLICFVALTYIYKA